MPETIEVTYSPDEGFNPPNIIGCQWYALCENYADTVREGPVGDGEFGPVPICNRCDAKVERLS